MKMIHFLLFLLFASCVPENRKTGVLDIGAPTERRKDMIQMEDSAAFKKLNETVLKPQGCIFCHKDWTASEMQLLTKVVPGEPFSSSLYLRMEDGTMPLGGPPVGKEDLELVEAYIRQLVVD